MADLQSIIVTKKSKTGNQSPINTCQGYWPDDFAVDCSHCHAGVGTKLPDNLLYKNQNQLDLGNNNPMRKVQYKEATEV